MLKAPFPYFGGKSMVAHEIWNALGQPKHYIEPFFGSGAVLLNRPNYVHGMVETVNDKDGFIANVWRALQHDPDQVAKWCDWPVNHADLAARKRKLIANESVLLDNLANDDEWFDAKLAGYWIWAASCWIGSGLTSFGQIPHVGHGGRGVHAIGKIPHLADGGRGVHAIGQIPHLANGGRGVHALGQIPHVSNSGVGVHAIGQRPHVSNSGRSVQEPYNTNIYLWFRELSERLRYVRVVCGDWTRVCGGNWQDMGGICGMFFDPPYGDVGRNENLYHHDSTDIAAEVEKWCLERGAQNTYRIVVAGYDEYKLLIEAGWTVKQWTAKGGYGNIAHNNNRHRETLYFSPYCMRDQDWLFDINDA